MDIIVAIATIKAAIDKSAQDESDTPWMQAVEAAGLVEQPDVGGTSIDVSYTGRLSGIDVRVQHTCRDTSKTFSIGPDRTRITLEISKDGAVIDRYTDGYES